METGALSCTPQTTGAIARWAGLGSTKTARRSVGKALYGRDGVGLINATRNGKPATLYFRRADEASGDC
jgi:hypothetical protein